MSQNATLYRLNKDNFSIILEDPEGTDLFGIAKEYITFQQTHEGLVFILSKNQNELTANLAKQIFYPKTNNSQSEDFDKINAGIIPKDFDFERFYKMMENILHYNKPEVVKEISDFLNEISENDFKILFDYKELNKKGVYPYNSWNDRVEKDRSFNGREMTVDFTRLKTFYQSAAREGDYILSFVG